MRKTVFGLRPSVSFYSASAKNFHFGASLKCIRLKNLWFLNNVKTYHNNLCKYLLESQGAFNSRKSANKCNGLLHPERRSLRW